MSRQVKGALKRIMKDRQTRRVNEGVDKYWRETW